MRMLGVSVVAGALFLTSASPRIHAADKDKTRVASPSPLAPA